MKKTIVVTLMLALISTVSAKDFGTVHIGKRDIVDVYDGDTFFINMPSCPPVLCKRIGVRINGIDSPEINGKCPEEKNLAALAKVKLEERILSGSVFEIRKVKREKYGRLLGDFFVDNQDIAAWMVANNLARHYNGKERQGWCPK